MALLDTLEKIRARANVDMGREDSRVPQMDKRQNFKEVFMRLEEVYKEGREAHKNSNERQRAAMEAMMQHEAQKRGKGPQGASQPQAQAQPTQAQAQPQAPQGSETIRPLLG